MSVPAVADSRAPDIVGSAWRKPSAAILLDHFVCNADHVGGEREPDCFGSLEINDHLEFARLDDRQIGGILAFENPSGIDASLPVHIAQVCAVAHEASRLNEIAGRVDRRNGVSE